MREEMALIDPIVYLIKGKIACDRADRPMLEHDLANWLGILLRLQALYERYTRGLKSEALKGSQ